jgi:hypothetical protein
MVLRRASDQAEMKTNRYWRQEVERATTESRSEIEEGTATSNREIERIGIVQSVVLCLGRALAGSKLPYAR